MYQSRQQYGQQQYGQQKYGQQQYGQQQYGQQQQAQQQGQQLTEQPMHLGLQDKDMATTVLNELKRMAAEYTTACTEAAAPNIRHMFEQLLHQTLADQEQLFQAMSRFHMYGQPVYAQHSDVQHEIEQGRHTAEQQQQLMRQWQERGQTIIHGNMHAQPADGRYHTASAEGPGYDMQQSGMQREQGMQYEQGMERQQGMQYDQAMQQQHVQPGRHSSALRGEFPLHYAEHNEQQQDVRSQGQGSMPLS